LLTPLQFHAAFFFVTPYLGFGATEPGLLPKKVKVFCDEDAKGTDLDGF
jgi:hypothetical protein